MATIKSSKGRKRIPAPRVSSKVKTKIIFRDRDNGDTKIEPLSITRNGDYIAPTGTAYSPVSVNISGGSSKLTLKTKIPCFAIETSSTSSYGNYNNILLLILADGTTTTDLSKIDEIVAIAYTGMVGGYSEIYAKSSVINDYKFTENHEVTRFEYNTEENKIYAYLVGGDSSRNVTYDWNLNEPLELQLGDIFGAGYYGG